MTRVVHGLAMVGALTLLASPAAGQGASGVRVNLYVDEGSYRAEEKRQEPFAMLSYRQMASKDGRVIVLPSNGDLMQRWKSNGPITSTDWGLFELQGQFLPALFVLDVTNESAMPAEIIRSYLRVRQSLTDRQPFIRMGGLTACDEWTSVVNLFNDGWRTAESAVLTFAFGRPGAMSAPFRVELGALGNVVYDPEKPLASLMPMLLALRSKPPRCAADKLQACLARMVAGGQLGTLAGKARLNGGEKEPVSMNSANREVNVTVPLAGTLSYQWKHHPSGELRTQQHSVQQEVFLFKFDTGHGPECGAGGPSETGYKSVTLPTDTSGYQVPLPYRGALPPRGNRRFQLPIRSERASSHEFEVVVETADGGVAVSPPVSLLYFLPIRNRSPLRELR